MTINDPPSAEIQRETLWKTYVEPYAEPNLYRSNRIFAAVEVLETFSQVRSQCALIRDERLTALTSGYAIFALIVGEIAPWLVDGCKAEIGVDEVPAGQAASVFLHSLATFSDHSVAPTHRSVVEPAAVLMPRALLTQLQHALEALRKGEVQDIFRPDATGRHDAPWTWDRMRTRAVQHVLFLHGQGVTKRIALTRLAALTKVGAETLRKWEAELRTEYSLSFDLALRAGKLSVKLKDDPDSWSADCPVDADELSTLRELRGEDLSAFGKSYRERYGKRHIQ